MKISKLGKVYRYAANDRLDPIMWITQSRTRTLTTVRQQNGIMIKSLIEQNKRSNWFHTVLLILSMAALLGILGYGAFGRWGFYGAIALVVFGLLFNERASAAMVLKMYKAQAIRTEQAPQLIQIFDQLCERADLEVRPRLYYVPSRMPNAFAVGTGKDVAVAITDGLLRMLNPRELAGVLAHEIAHVMHRDIRVMAMADTIARATSALSRFGMIILLVSISSALLGPMPLRWVLVGLLMFAAPTLTVLMQLALSRTREFSADQGAAELTGDPLGLASALAKIERPNPVGFWKRVIRPGAHRKEPAMLRTHPPTAERIERLRELTEQAQAINSPLRPSDPRHIRVSGMARVKRKPTYHLLTGLWY